MADIIITPGSSIMSFTSSANYTQTLTQDASGSLILQGSGSTGRTDLFTVNGNNGTLFSVSDDLSDSLFSVNTIAGLPVIEAFANNTVTLGQYGQNVLVVTGSRVGIGTSAPAYKLSIAAASTSDGIQILYGGASRFIFNGDGVAYWGGSSASAGQLTWDTGKAIIMGQSGNALSLGSNGTWDRMFLDTSGNVGIGTTSPTVISNYRTNTLDAASGTFTEYRQNGTALFRIGADGSRPFLYGMTNAAMDFFTNTSVRMTIAAGGNVGIGITNPGNKLVVNGGVSGTPSWDNNTIEVRAESGLTAAISLHRAGYTTAEIYSDNGAIAFRESGADRLRITGGSIGIGTASPSYPLHVYTSSTSANVIGVTNGTQNLTLGVNNSSGGSFLFENGNNALRFGTNGSERVRIDNSGKVGIGTTTPGSGLEISGPTGNYASGIGFVSTGTGARTYRTYMGTNGSFYFDDATAGATRLTLNSSGYLGIGTTSPGYNLEVNGWVGASRYYPYSSNSTYIDGDGSGLRITGTGYLYVPASGGSYFEGPVRFRDSIYNDQDTYLQINGGTSNITYFAGTVGVGFTTMYHNASLSVANKIFLSQDNNSDIGGSIYGYWDSGYQAYAGGLKFQSFNINGGGSYTMKDTMILTGNGNVGIGTTNPSARLHTLINDNSFSPNIYIENTNTGTSALASIILKNASQNVASIYQQNANGDLGIYNSATTGNLNFFTNASNRMTILSGGNVGVGTSNPGYKLEVIGTTAVSSDLTMYGGSGYYLRLNGGTGALGYDSGNNQILSYTPADYTMWMGATKNLVSATIKGGITELIPQSQIESDYVSAISAQGSIITRAVAGASVVTSQLVTLNSSNQWVLADADSSTTSTRLLGVALNTAGVNEFLAVLLEGTYSTQTYHDQLNSPASPGAPIYISTTAGNVTQTAPTGTGKVVRLVGHNLYGTTGRAAAAVIRFKPDATWVEL